MKLLKAILKAVGLMILTLSITAIILITTYISPIVGFIGVIIILTIIVAIMFYIL